MMKSYKHVNKKTQIDPANILRRKTLTINRFLVGQICFFSTAINLWLIYRFSGNLITDNLTSFDALFQHLNID